MDDSLVPEAGGAEELLAARPVGAADQLREALRRQTTGVLRRRRWQRRFGFAAALAACYGAGLLTMKWLPAPPVAGPGEVAAQAPEAAPRTAPEPPAPARQPPSEPAPSPLALEWQALDSKEKRPDLFRAAGDRYLEEAGDVQSAMRCYRNYLDASSDAEAVVSANDNWLLMALKEAKQREKRDAKSGS